jgi:uncharacterized membrane protein SpoIIM required for sporulation
MREHTFVANRQEGWDRLEALLARADRSGLRSFPAADLQALGFSYRSATSDLAVAQSRNYSEDLRAYLNRLVARAHAYVYADVTGNSWRRVARFFSEVFPSEVRASWRPILACTALFVLAAIASYWIVAQRPLSVYALLPAEDVPLIRKSLHDSNFAFDSSFAPVMSSAIITNNIKVAAIAFAGGMTVGIVTLWEILNNGLMVGSLGALFATKGFGRDFWATVAPHGVIELSAIQIAGGAGLLLAQAIVAPGRLRRADALRVNGRRAGVLMLGVAGMLVVAGLIEGFVSPTRTSEGFRLSVGALTGVLLIAYLGLAGRPRVR